MRIDMEGRVALVTGASKGIGLAIASELFESGAKVLISSRKKEGLEKAAASLAAGEHGSGAGNVSWFVANAGEPEDISACVAACMERYGRVDVLVNNAATNPYMGPTIDIDLSRADKIYQVNLRGPLLWSQEVWKAWMGEHGGTIVNIASLGAMMVEPSIGWYNVMKAGLVHLTRHLASDMAPSVRVNAVAPGVVKTDFARALWEPGDGALAKMILLGRLGVPEDVAKLAVFLASDASSWITGQTVVIDGGTMLGFRLAGA